MIKFDALAALPYAFGAPEACARFKQTPEDFAVYEQLGYEPEAGAQNEHLWLYVEKRGENTVWVAKRLAKHFARPERDVSFAGLKDRQAVTRQWFSVRLAAEARLESLSIPNAVVLKSVFCPKKLQRGGLQGNRFVLQLREVTDTQAVIQRFREISATGFPNYFGEQRFGHHSGNLFGAERWRRGFIRPRGRNEKAFFISALRAWLFNLQVANACVEEEKLKDGFLPGAMRFEMPRELTLLADQYGDHFEFLAQQGCSIQKRALLCMPQNPTSFIEGDSVRLEFDLPAGSYATSLLRELVKTVI